MHATIVPYPGFLHKREGGPGYEARAVVQCRNGTAVFYDVLELQELMHDVFV